MTPYVVINYTLVCSTPPNAAPLLFITRSWKFMVFWFLSLLWTPYAVGPFCYICKVAIAE